MILDESYRDDLVEQLKDIDTDRLSDEAKEKVKNILADTDSHPDLDSLWVLFQKSVQEYDVDPDYAVLDALEDAYHIPFHPKL